MLDTVVKPSSSGAERAVVEDDEATPRGSAEGVDSRAAAGVATTVGFIYSRSRDGWRRRVAGSLIGRRTAT